MTNCIELKGLDGANPLAFLAAVGTLRTVRLAFPDDRPRLRWKAEGKWFPELWLEVTKDREELLEQLHKQLATLRAEPALEFGDNLNVPCREFAEVCSEATKRATLRERTGADLVAAFGCDAIGARENPAIMQDTAFRTMSGTGHQDFLAFMRNIVRETQVRHLEKALFGMWEYDDPIKNLTLRLDPQEDVRYALRWRNPSDETAARARSGSMLGANRLAIEGLTLFPCVPVNGRLETTGFRGRRSSDTYFTWPIWETPITEDVVRSLLALRDLQEKEPDRGRLTALGVVEVFRSQRITVGKFRNFTPAQAV